MFGIAEHGTLSIRRMGVWLFAPHPFKIKATFHRQHTMGSTSASVAERLMEAIGKRTYESGNFIVTDAMQKDYPICFVSDGFCKLTGNGAAKSETLWQHGMTPKSCRLFA
jgi:hypothetical protein